jgi:hypothetical protein
LASALFQSVSSIGGSSPVAFARTDHSGRPIPRRHPLTLIVFPANSLARALRIDGLCVLARLSSFQRTDEVRQGRPTDLPSARPFRARAPSHRSGPAGKASPHVVCGAFRGTFRGYRHRHTLSTPKMRPPSKTSKRLRSRRTLELRTARWNGCRFPAVRTFREYPVLIAGRQVSRTR